MISEFVRQFAPVEWDRLEALEGAAGITPGRDLLWYQNLAARGLAEPVVLASGDGFRITDIGRRLVLAMRSAAQEGPMLAMHYNRARSGSVG